MTITGRPTSYRPDHCCLARGEPKPFTVPVSAYGRAGAAAVLIEDEITPRALTAAGKSAGSARCVCRQAPTITRQEGWRAGGNWAARDIEQCSQPTNRQNPLLRPWLALSRAT